MALEIELSDWLANSHFLVDLHTQDHRPHAMGGMPRHHDHNYSRSGVSWRASEGKALEDNQAVVLPDIMTRMMTDIAGSEACF